MTIAVDMGRKATKTNKKQQVIDAVCRVHTKTGCIHVAPYCMAFSTLYIFSKHKKKRTQYNLSVFRKMTCDGTIWFTPVQRHVSYCVCDGNHLNRHHGHPGHHTQTLCLCEYDLLFNPTGYLPRLVHCSPFYVTIFDYRFLTGDKPCKMPKYLSMVLILSYENGLRKTKRINCLDVSNSEKIFVVIFFQMKTILETQC